ncbi:MAG: hypothetical protein KJN89_05550 [Gammaproteobacteria bacterium]|nr:hypothetical protein [Gammaproteobacteria bacterium]NNJ49819.1 hypothetical protein [Gammaproteobacteria bacterium]
MKNIFQQFITGCNGLKHSIYRVALVVSVGIFNSAQASNSVDKSWDFKVYLDGDEIGFHNFSVVHKETHQEIYSSARFDVKFLFFNAYSYEHDNVEHWRGQCLKSINAVTNDNGDRYNVSGQVDNDGFIVETLDNKSSYQPCIKTFAYWDPDFLKESRLLNSQTGEMVKVKSQFIGNETMTHMGKETEARRYRLTGENLQIDLWYSDDDQWLALESLTEGGRVVRYEIP